MRFLRRRPHLDAVIDEVSLQSKIRIYAHLYKTASGVQEQKIVDERVAELIREIEGNSRQRATYTKLYEEEKC